MWIVVPANTLGVSDTALLWILGLHVAVSIGFALSLWGAGNNFIQRLNFARWLAERFWPRIATLGGPAYAWRGVPSEGSPTPTVLSLDDWRERQAQNGNVAGTLDFYVRYRAFQWPSIRFQRLWFCVPLIAAGFSLSLFAQLRGDGPLRKALCEQVSQTLSFPDAAPVPRETWERARYVFDKAGCDITKIRLTRPAGSQDRKL